MKPPYRNPADCDTCHASFALRPRTEVGLSQETPNAISDIKRPDVEKRQAETIAAHALREEVWVSSEKRRPPQASQQWNDLVIQHSLATNIVANLAHAHAPFAKLRSLTLEDVLVENNHTDTLCEHFVVGIDHCLASESDSLCDRRPRDAATAFLHDIVPIHARRDQFQDVAHQKPRAAKGRLAMTDLRIGNNISSGRFLFHLVSNRTLDPARHRYERHTSIVPRRNRTIEKPTYRQELKTVALQTAGERSAG
jgi:hypothetical protein